MVEPRLTPSGYLSLSVFVQGRQKHVETREDDMMVVCHTTRPLGQGLPSRVSLSPDRAKVKVFGDQEDSLAHLHDDWL